MAITMSSSLAPAAIASPASYALTAEELSPWGKPTTEATGTPLPSSAWAAVGTQTGATQTALKPWSRASRQSSRMRSFVVSGFNAVWSM